MSKGKYVDLTGHRFGTLTVVDQKASKPKRVVCVCDCGAVREVLKSNLMTGNTKTCGKPECREALRSMTNTYSTEEKQLEEMVSTPFENRRRVLDINNKYHKDNNIKKGLSTSKRNSSGYVGVAWNKRDRRWQATIGFRGENIYLGNYQIFDDAVRARKEAEDMLFAPSIAVKKKFHKKSYKCVDTGIGA